MNTTEQERQTIRDAMARLVEGQPVQSDGKLTVKSLAEEAGLKRWVLTHKHLDLQQEFRAMVSRNGRDPEPVRLLKTRVEELEQETKRLRLELRQAKATCSMLERHIAVDALESHAAASSSQSKPRLRPVR